MQIKKSAWKVEQEKLERKENFIVALAFLLGIIVLGAYISIQIQISNTIAEPHYMIDGKVLPRNEAQVNSYLK